MLPFYRQSGRYPFVTACSEVNASYQHENLVRLGFRDPMHFFRLNWRDFRALHPDMTITELYENVIPGSYLNLKVDFDPKVTQTARSRAPVNLPPTEMSSTFIMIEPLLLR